MIAILQDYKVYNLSADSFSVSLFRRTLLWYYATVLSGVPQSTVLGPLLFLIMLSDIDKDVSKSNIVNFADDTQMYKKNQDVTN